MLFSRRQKCTAVIYPLPSCPTNSSNYSAVTVNCLASSIHAKIRLSLLFLSNDKHISISASVYCVQQTNKTVSLYLSLALACLVGISPESSTFLMSGRSFIIFVALTPILSLSALISANCFLIWSRFAGSLMSKSYYT